MRGALSSLGMPEQRGTSPAVLDTIQTIALDRIARTVTVAFAGAGIPVILLKGPAIARWLYDDGTHRPYFDIDLLVRPADWERATAILAEMGFRDRDRWRGGEGTDRMAHAATWARADGCAVDLHWSVFGATVAPEIVWQVLSARTETVRVGRVELPILARGPLAAQVALHAAQHGAREPQPIADVERLVQRATADDWREARQVVDELGATEAFAAGLRLVPAGDAVAHRLGLPTGVSTVVAVRGTARPGRSGALAIEELRATQGVRRRASLLWRQLVPAASHMRARYPFARRGRIGLAFAYAWRILTFVPRSIAGLWAWRRGRRTSARSRDRSPGPAMGVGRAGRILRGLARLSPLEKVATLRALVLIARIEIGLRTSPLPRLAGRLGVELDRRGGARAVLPPAEPGLFTATEQRRLDAVDRVLRHWPPGGTCLRRGLAAGRVLTDHGPVLVLGVAADGAELRGHAWVEVAGSTVGDDEKQPYHLLGRVRRDALR